MGLVALVGALAWGCGSAPAAPESPPKTEARQPSIADFASMSAPDAEKELARAEASLEATIGLRIDGVADASGEPRPSAPPRPAESTATTPSVDGQTASANSACENACDALASMKRAAQRICALDAERCSAVQARVTKATERVHSRCAECE